MPRVIGVSFREAGKIYYFEIEDLDILPGNHVVVETSQGTELAEVVLPPENMPETEVVVPLKKITRKATEEDLQLRKVQEGIEKEALRTCQEKINQHKLSMKLIDAECLFDETKLVFYFTADSRVDFRELVKDLAATFKKRIELRQIGVRDEAKILGGLGSCGCRLCCNTFLKNFEPVSVKLAKEQNLPLNPFKISGICGRLMCCLRYEYDNYKDFNKRAPRRGASVKTEHGIGRVIDFNMCRDSVIVEVSDGFRYDVPLTALEIKSQAPKIKNKEPRNKEPRNKDNNSNKR